VAPHYPPLNSTFNRNHDSRTECKFTPAFPFFPPTTAWPPFFSQLRCPKYSCHASALFSCHTSDPAPFLLYPFESVLLKSAYVVKKISPPFFFFLPCSPPRVKPIRSHITVHRSPESFLLPFPPSEIRRTGICLSTCRWRTGALPHCASLPFLQQILP